MRPRDYVTRNGFEFFGMVVDPLQGDILHGLKLYMNESFHPNNRLR